MQKCMYITKMLSIYTTKCMYIAPTYLILDDDSMPGQQVWSLPNISEW